MKLMRLLLVLLTTLFISCTGNNRNKIAAILNDSNLPSQDFSVNIDRDTTLLTKNGCVIKIPKGTFESDSSNIKLEIKEALTMSDIIIAGLTTMSGKQSLSSGGMIYISTAGSYKATIKKQIEISIPTKTYNPDMQVFKGAQDNSGKIDWIDPMPLPKDETNTKISDGELMFKANCANCHKIYDDYTGPGLYGITERRPKKWLYDFTRNPIGTAMATVNTEAYDFPAGDTTKRSDGLENNSGTDFYAACLLNRWKPTVMTAFPMLTDPDLDALYSYIKSESDKRPDLKEKYKKGCCDSCELYKKQLLALSEIKNKRERLINDNEDFFNLDRTFPVPVFTPTGTNDTNNIDNTNYVSPTSVKATYYTINVETFGWYNLDCIMERVPGCKESELFVQIQDVHNLEYNVCLIIPDRKVFVEGGKLDNGSQYGFFETNGKIILPQNEQCYVVAFAQYKDKFIYGKTSFISAINQTISLTVNEATKETIFKDFSTLKLNGVNMEIKNSKNSNEIRDTDKKIDSLKEYLPKNCDCMFDFPNTTDILAKK